MGDMQPLQNLANELVDDLGDLLPVTSASALIDVIQAKKREKFLRVEDRRLAKTLDAASCPRM